MQRVANETPQTFLPVEKVSSPAVLLQSEKESEAGDLFGKFHCDRASYYIIRHPKERLFGAEVVSITLFYLDSALLQTKYEMRYDISLILINQTGNCRITGLNEKNRKIISEEWVVKRTKDGLMLHPELDSYELIWRLPDRELRYRFTDEGFFYYERYRGYEQKLKLLEAICN
ncbi:MAG: hypothetical protein N2044_01980 [Cyclobacteriaceae bacterium]|nr:hypothetical protein [Cyclobacteriaceae bacterium]MCX7636593.1 hypothetical protein [Cyclobacteriaceae bacterium]MDW8330607.1 hypothetical protein [Cyclobacteriaceae bacterium]